MKKYLFLAIAALGFAACSDSDLNGGKGPIHKGEIEESYIAINLSASEGTRAEGEGYNYVEGAAAERAVKTAHFFFFKDGVPFPVNVTEDTVTAPGGTINHLSITLSENSTSGMNNVSDIKDAVLLLSSYKGEYPNQIVAVLNWNPVVDKAYYLSELKTAVNIATKYDSTNFFVMSNAVYATTDSKAMEATPLTEDNIKSSAEDAMAAPVKIYVERVAAKVMVTTDNGQTRINLNNPVNPVGGTQTDVYVDLLGWELYNDNTKSYLLKNIDPTWTVETLGFNWNDAPWYRSYWATSLPRPTDESNAFKMTYTDAEKTANGFATKYGFNIGNDKTDGTATEVAGSYTYVGENTINKAEGTKVILKAKLVNSSGEALEIASWYGNEYVGEVNLRTAVANTLKYTLFSKQTSSEGDTYTGITPDDLQCVAGGSEGAPTNVAANEVYFQLSTETNLGTNKEWYKLENGEYKPVATDLSLDVYSVEATNKYLADYVKPGVLYKDGETFYYVDIKHLGAEGETAEYGVVRNHIYNVIINTIGGYGSPVYEGTQDIVTPQYPDTPEAEESFVAAQINILSWRLVDQEVDIQPQNPQN